MGRTVQPGTFVAFMITIAQMLALYPVAQVVSQLKWLHFRDKQRSLEDLDLFDEGSRLDFLGAFNFVSEITFKALMAGVIRCGIICGLRTRRRSNVHNLSASSIMATLACLLVMIGQFFGPFAQRSVYIYLQTDVDPNGDASLHTSINYIIKNGTSGKCAALHGYVID